MSTDQQTTNPACDREHTDEWVEVDEDTWDDLPDGTRLRREWRKGHWRTSEGFFVHRDDLPDPDADLIERTAQAIHAADSQPFEWVIEPDRVHGKYRALARAALAVVRDPNAGRVRWCNCADAPWDDAKCREGECRESWRDAEEAGR